jgi:hypothetical protein
VPAFFNARRLASEAGVAGHTWFALLAAVLAIGGATFLTLLGSSYNDATLALFPLAALALLLSPTLRPATLALSGLCAGIGVGLKLTLAPYALGAVAAMTYVAWRNRLGWRAWSVGLLASAVGFAITAGPWMYAVWSRFGDPVFPQLGSIFHSPYSPPFPVRDTSRLPIDAWHAIAFPIHFLNHWREAGEASLFRDVRFALLLFALPIFWLSRERRRERPFAFSVLTWFLAVAYPAWLLVFGFYRYAATMEALAAPLLLAILASWLRSPRRIAVGVPLLALLIAGSTKPMEFGRLEHYTRHAFDVRLPDLPPEPFTVVLPDNDPLAYLALAFPPSTHWIRVGGNFFGWPYPPYSMDELARQRLAAAPPTRLLITRTPDGEWTTNALARFGMTVAPESCQPLVSTIERFDKPLQICGIVHAESPR